MTAPHDPDRTMAEAVLGVQIAWWELTQTLAGTFRGRIFLRALRWYQAALRARARYALWRIRSHRDAVARLEEWLR